MRSAYRIALIATALGAAAATAFAQTIKPTLDINDMRVVIQFVSIGQITNLQRRFGANVDQKDLRQEHRRGFSILKTYPETGARKCEIYLPEEQRPREVDDDGTLSLGHELLHCMYGDYHR